MPLNQEDLSLLARCSLFQGVEASLLESLAGMEGAGPASFAPGQVVYDPDCFRRSLAIVLSGQLQVTKGPLTVSVLGPG